MTIQANLPPSLFQFEASRPANASSAGAPNFAKLLEAQPPPREPGVSGRTLVNATRTPLSGEQASVALSHAWTQTFGEPPNKATVAILTAQWSHETGRGEQMFNYNFGGIKGTGPSGLTVSQRTREGSGSTAHTIVDNFRAYRTPTEGASDYISLLNRRYGNALDAARDGDPGGFVRELKAGGYFTGDETLYTRSITRLAQQSLDRGAGVLGEGGPLPDHELLSQPETAGRHRVPQSAPQGHGSSAPDLAAFVDSFHAEAIAEEMSRAALRIAASSTDSSKERSR